MGTLIILAVAGHLIPWITVRTKLQLLGIGRLWVVLNTQFESGLGGR